MSSNAFLYALIGGILPTLLWLWFWLREDRRRPEPRGMIIRTFLMGMLVVPLVLPFEKAAAAYFGDGTFTLVIWAAIEEIFKYAAALVAALRTRFMDEPVDGIIYLITAALGFAALENVLFLSGPFGDGELVAGIVTGNLRFIGATLLHTVSSSAIGAGIALSFYKHRAVKIEYVLTGMICAIALHALFNFLILQKSEDNFFLVFGMVWAFVVSLIVLFERVKRIHWG